MRLTPRACALLLALAACTRPPAPASPPVDEQPFEVVTERDVLIPMRDGVRLATDVHRPARGGRAVPGAFPVLLERTPYGKGNTNERNPAGAAAFFVSRGYVVVIQDVRGRHGSEGRWRPHRDDGPDGADTTEWIGEQPWSNGRIGTLGTSYPGGTQHALAIARAPHLAALFPVDAMSNCGRYGIRHHGAFELRWVNWVMTLGNPWVNGAPPASTLRAFYPVADRSGRAALEALAREVVAIVRNPPLRPGATALRLAPDYESWLVEAMRHGDYDEFWKDMGSSVVDHVAEYKDVPVQHVSGWYDSWSAQVANLSFVALSRAKRGPQRLLMGPWTHGGQARSFAGMAEFGPEAELDLRALQLRWFDRWLKGIRNGVDSEPPVRIFVMGTGDGHQTPEGRVFLGGYWRDEREWPLARAQLTPYYLQPDGRLSPDLPPLSAPAKYRFDPRNPVPSIGGNVSSQGQLMLAGAIDQRCRPDFWMCRDAGRLSERADVLVFRTPPLAQDVEVTGPVRVRLWASSSAPDTDFTAKLVDVHPPSADFPGGLELNVADGIVRARYRDSLERPERMTPEKIYAFEIETYPTSIVFRKGHRIRLDVSSSNFPRFDVNPNTGEPLNANERSAQATNRIYHDPERPSHVLLPIIPAAAPAEGGAP